MSDDKGAWRAIGREVSAQPDGMSIGTLAVRILRDVVRALGLDLEHAKVADIAPAVEALLARVAELEAAQRWIPVGERLPDDGAIVLAVIDWPPESSTRQPWVWLCKFNMQRFRLCDGPFDWNMTSRVTHWRPRPAIPEVQP